MVAIMLVFATLHLCKVRVIFYLLWKCGKPIMVKGTCPHLWGLCREKPPPLLPKS